MKIYTSEVSQFGRTLLICNKEVTFDKVGCAEVEDSHGKELINYAPDWYSKDKKELKKEVKKLDEDTLMKNFEIEELQGKIEQLKKMDESRVSALKAKESENDQIREEMGKVVEQKAALELDLQNKEEIWNKEKKDIIFVSPGYKDGALKRLSDKLNLTGFFPMLFPIMTRYLDWVAFRRVGMFGVRGTVHSLDVSTC